MRIVFACLAVAAAGLGHPWATPMRPVPAANRTPLAADCDAQFQAGLACQVMDLEGGSPSGPPGQTVPANLSPRDPIPRGVDPASQPFASQTPGSPPRSALVVDPQVIELGAVGHMEQRRVSFAVVNTGAQAVSLERVTRSCDCMTVTLATGPLAAGAALSGEVHIELGRGFGTFDKHLDLHFAGLAPVVVPVRAVFHPGLQVRAQAGGAALREFVLTAALGNDLPQSRQTAVLTRPARHPQLTNVGVHPVRSTLAHPGLTVRQDSTAEGVHLTVEVSPAHPPGPIAGDVKCTVDGLALVIPVRGRVHRGLLYEPESFNFSRIDDAARARCEVLITATDGRLFKILETRVEAGSRSPPDAVLIEVQAAEPAGFRIIARPRPDLTPGSRLFGEVIVRSDHPECSELRLHYMGFISPPDGRRRP